MNIEWTDNAKEHLAAIHSHIAQGSTHFANQTVYRLTRRVEQVAKFPLSGRRVEEFGVDQIREVIEGSYRIIYYIAPSRIEVLAVIHCARDVI